MIFEKLKCKVLYDELLKKHTTFGIGGKCIALIEVESVEDIIISLMIIKENKLNYFILGNGSNILVPDEGYNGVIIKLHNKFSKILVENNKIFVSAGAKNSHIFDVALENSLTGFEFASGIPGTIGGAVYMNAGAYDGEIKNIVEYVDVIDCETLEIKRLSNVDLNFSYRKSIIQEKNYIIVNVCLNLKKGIYDNIKSVYEDLQFRRNSKQPLNYKSGGSTFKRPIGFYASKLIEDSGLKGYSINDAEVSSKHAGFIINKGNASFEDVMNLVEYVKKVVFEKYRVKLEMEVKILKD